MEGSPEVTPYLTLRKHPASRLLPLLHNCNLEMSVLRLGGLTILMRPHRELRMELGLGVSRDRAVHGSHALVCVYVCVCVYVY